MAKLAGLALVALLGCVVARTCEASIGFSYSLPGMFKPRPSPYAPGLSVGYYQKYTTCPQAEDTVRRIVERKVLAEPGIGAGLIRLFFHDCFVQGCDASILLLGTPANQPTELEGPPNKDSLRGLDVIKEVKEALEEMRGCQGIVSCADIIAFAGRDATRVLDNVNDWFNYFPMPAGRYDGRVSLASETTDLPPPFADVQLLKDMFKAKGFTPEEMVTLSGAHTIGISRCSSFSDNPQTFARSVNAQCSSTVPLDAVTADVLDHQYYKNVVRNETLFKSDAALMTSDDTKREVYLNAFNYEGRWEKNFMAAMVKMGNIEVKNKYNGEIRRDCRFVNRY